MMAIIKTIDLVKRYDNSDVLKGITTEFESGTITTIIGPSGGGKSTFLRCLNLLENPSSGNVYFAGIDLTDRHTKLNDIRQKIGMVFQSFHLFDNLTVLGNVVIGQEKVLHRTKEEAIKKADYFLQKVGMLEFRNRSVKTLSGGQKQRVAIARTLAMEPKVILFDEPTSSLDPLMVGEVLNVIKNVVLDHSFTAIIVTHEIEFAREISDRIIYMEDGRIMLDATPKDLFQNPTHPSVKRFLSRFV